MSATTDRKPWLAALLSLAAPGLGHLYAGIPRRALGWWLGSLSVIALVPLVVIQLSPGPLPAALVWLLPVGFVAGAAVAAARLARNAPRPYTMAAYNRWTVYLLAWVGSAVVSQLVVRPLVRTKVEAFRVPAASMEPTVMSGDFLYASKPADRPLRHGQVVIFYSVEELGLQVIKRIVGLPGDTVAMSDGRLLRNGVPVPEPYLPNTNSHRTESPEYRDRMAAWQRRYLVGSDSTYAPDLNDWGPLVVPPESLFVLGDNRAASYDSRYWGFLPVVHLIGQPRLVYFSYDPKAPSTVPWLTAVRWGRMGYWVPEAAASH